MVEVMVSFRGFSLPVEAAAQSNYGFIKVMGGKTLLQVLFEKLVGRKIVLPKALSVEIEKASGYVVSPKQIKLAMRAIRVALKKSRNKRLRAMRFVGFGENDEKPRIELKQNGHSIAITLEKEEQAQGGGIPGIKSICQALFADLIHGRTVSVEDYERRFFASKPAIKWCLKAIEQAARVSNDPFLANRKIVRVGIGGARAARRRFGRTGAFTEQQQRIIERTIRRLSRTGHHTVPEIRNACLGALRSVSIGAKRSRVKLCPATIKRTCKRMGLQIPIMQRRPRA